MFAKDMTELDYSWMVERIERCCVQIWEVSEQILGINGSVVLDLGFTSKAQREVFFGKAKSIGIEAELHLMESSIDIRKQRVRKRNSEKILLCMLLRLLT